MIKVAYVLGKLHSGGKKNLVMEYYRHMDTNKVRIDFICDSDSNSIPEEELKTLGGKVFRITPYENIVQNMREMGKIFEEEHYDVVHAWDSTMNLFPVEASSFLSSGLCSYFNMSTYLSASTMSIPQSGLTPTAFS